jgi:hypothetical protein
VGGVVDRDSVEGRKIEEKEKKAINWFKSVYF